MVVIGAFAVASVFVSAEQAAWFVPGGGAIALAAMLRAAFQRRVRRQADRSRLPFVLLFAGLGLTVASEVLVAGHGSEALVAGVALSAYPFLLAGLVALHSSRVRERAVDTLLVAAIVPSALFAFGWLPLVDAVESWTAGDGEQRWGAWLLLGVDALAVAIIARLAVMFRGRPVAYQMLLASSGCLLGAHVSRAVASVSGATPAPLGTQAVLLASFALMAGAVLHPSVHRQEGTRPRAVSIGRPHLVLLVATVLVGPAFVLLRYGDQGSWVLMAAIGPAAVSLLVMAHLARLISERQRLEFLSSHDALTGLPNRSAFHDRLALALARVSDRRGPTVMFLDLDRFKHVNDTLGHDVGDELLRQVAERLGDCIRDGDTVARLAGDEFALLVVAPAGSSRADEVAQRILSRFAEPFRVGGVALSVTPSIGIATAPQHGTNVESLLRNADSAMYAAKASGRNTVRTYTRGMASAAERHLLLEQRLRRSITDGELVVHYQPRVDASSNRLLGVEALVRWNHPRLGLVPPAAFIGIAENTGFIAELGEWVLQQACNDAAAWRRAGAELAVSVNVSPRQFSLQDVPAVVQAALDGARLPAEALELELTESLHLTDDGSVGVALNRIHQTGVRCAVDDFGTGYSSIAALRDYPIGVVKLDRSFVAPVGDLGDAPLVRAVVQLAQGLGMRVVAEGVETQEQLQFLRGLMCDEVQGYLISRAVPADQVLSLASSRVNPSEVPALAPVVLDVDERRLTELLWADRDQSNDDESESNGRLAAVLGTAATVMAVPVILGVGAGGGLPPSVQGSVTTALESIGAEPPRRPSGPMDGLLDGALVAGPERGKRSEAATGGRLRATGRLEPLSVRAMAAESGAATSTVLVGELTETSPATTSSGATGPGPTVGTSRPGNGGGRPTEPPGNGGGNGGGRPTEPPGNGGGKPAEPPGNGGGKPTEPPGNGGGKPAEPPGNGGGKPAEPPGNGGGKPAEPPGNGGGKPAEPPGNGGGKPAEPPGNGGGKPAEPPGKPADLPGNGNGNGKPAEPPGKPADLPGNGNGKPADPPGKPADVPVPQA